jgi:hypothetical protein
MAIFCAAAPTSPSPNWPDVASQSAQYGNGTAKLMSELLYSITVVLKDNSDIQTLERYAEAGVSSRDTG